MKKAVFLFLFSTLFILSPAQTINGIAKGSMVILANGVPINVNELVEGDKLLTINTKDVSMQVSSVKSIRIGSNKNLQQIALADGNQLTLTSDHPLLINRGWAAFDKNAAKRIRKYSNQKIRNYNTNTFVYNLSANTEIRVLPIIEIKAINENTEVYNIELDNPDVAFIANSLFVGQ